MIRPNSKIGSLDEEQKAGTIAGVHVTGSVNQELLLQNEYLAAENRILRAKLRTKLRLSKDWSARLVPLHLHSTLCEAQEFCCSPDFRVYQEPRRRLPNAAREREQTQAMLFGFAEWPCHELSRASTL